MKIYLMISLSIFQIKLFSQWSGTNPTTISDDILINGNLNLESSTSIRPLTIKSSTARSGFVLQHLAPGYENDRFVFELRGDKGDLTMSVHDADVGWKGLIRYNYTDRIVKFNNNNIYNIGSIGIGLDDPVTEGNILEVNGSSRMEEVKVQMRWPDYVFEDDYIKPTIDDEEKFINENGHLLGFKSAQELGEYIGLSEATKSQQEKIELIMLYIIEINNRLKKIEMVEKQKNRE